MASDGKTALDALNWGASSGGAAGTGETTSTLGVARQDQRVPPDLTRVWAAQINAMESLLLSMTAYFKGGTRLQVLTQSANPFGAGESGYYIDTNGEPWSVFNGARTALSSVSVASQDVASLGASTTLATLTSPVSGLYRVSVSVSAHTNNDTVSATITYTDAVEGFATTLTPISSVALVHDSNTGTTGSTTVIRASAATNIVVTLSATTQTTTKASAVIERLN